MRRSLARRQLLTAAAAGAVGATGAVILAACGEAQVVTKEVERIVTKEVPVEKIVTKEVPVEKTVEKVVTNEVEKVDTKEV